MSHLHSEAMCDLCGTPSMAVVNMVVYGNQADACRDCFINRWMWPADSPAPVQEQAVEVNIPAHVVELIAMLRERFPGATIEYEHGPDSA